MSQNESIHLEDMVKYIGIADCYGLESFLPYDESQLFTLYMRARANRHRHALAYIGELEEDAVEDINKSMKNGNYQQALLKLKSSVKVNIFRYCMRCVKIVQEAGMFAVKEMEPIREVFEPLLKGLIFKPTKCVECGEFLFPLGYSWSSLGWMRARWLVPKFNEFSRLHLS